MLHLQDKSSSVLRARGNGSHKPSQQEPRKRLPESGSTSGSLHHTGLSVWERYPLLPLSVISKKLHSPLSALS